jgi:prepilin peptidase CpaA
VTASAWLLLPALPIGAWAAWSDLARMTIPNRAVLALAMGFLLVAPVALAPPEIGARVLQAAAVLALGVALWAGRFLGAGDAKFAAAMALYVAPSEAAEFLYLLAGVLLAAFVAHRALRAIPLVRLAAPGWASWERREFPLGLALGPALVAHLALSAAGAL